MKLNELIKSGKEKLIENNVDDSFIISKIIAKYLFKLSDVQLISDGNQEISELNQKEYNNFIDKIINGVPVQYLTNNQEFMKLNFYVDENVLIPQPDTEIIVEEIINQYKNKNCRILDLCTGSGAIAVSLAKYIDNSHIIASDISFKALQIAKLNSEKNKVKNKINFVESDMFENISNENLFDVIVSNPPYIKSDVIDNLSKQVKNEPHIALDGGKDGLNFYKIIIDNSFKYLKNGGKIFVEIGFDQKDEVINLFKNCNFYKNILCKKDLGGNDRMIIAEKW